MLYTFVVILAIITAILLILVVLVQNSRGGAGAGPAFGETTMQVVGVKQGIDLVERITWIFAISLMIFCLASKPLMRLDQPASFESPNVKKAKEAKPILPKSDNQKKETDSKSVPNKPTEKKSENK
ncbi:MAG: preprotein translocase subunit SecG [Microscillaceae bacterium]|nr:preprotein translocase subunit SecG [Microscillaceae bacterium]MDW8461788.1 preprotein translocase subunit SecG [Cytophagales bacterium]